MSLTDGPLKDNNDMSTKHVPQPSNASHPTLADGAASAESQALADDAGAAAGAQTAQGSDLYARALERLDEMDAAIVNYMFFRDNPQVVPLLRALLVERQASPTCRKCRGSGTISVKHGMIFDTDSKDEIADAFHKETCGCRKAADATLRKFVEGTNPPNQRAHRTEEERTRQQSREAKLSETS